MCLPKAPASPCAGQELDKAGSRGGPAISTICKGGRDAWHASVAARQAVATPIKARRKAVDELGERLGDLHDLFVMRAAFEADDEPLGTQGRKLLGKLLKLGKEAERLPRREPPTVRRQPQTLDENSPARRVTIWRSPDDLRKQLTELIFGRVSRRPSFACRRANHLS